MVRIHLPPGASPLQPDFGRRRATAALARPPLRHGSGCRTFGVHLRLSRISPPTTLGGIMIEWVNQVWCSDVTYIPMAKGFLYLVVVMDWASRAVLGWRLSNTLGAESQ
jgi:transposase InsO family protein